MTPDAHRNTLAQSFDATARHPRGGYRGGTLDPSARSGAIDDAGTLTMPTPRAHLAAEAARLADQAAYLTAAVSSHAIDWEARAAAAEAERDALRDEVARLRRLIEAQGQEPT